MLGVKAADARGIKRRLRVDAGAFGFRASGQDGLGIRVTRVTKTCCRGRRKKKNLGCAGFHGVAQGFIRVVKKGLNDVISRLKALLGEGCVSRGPWIRASEEHAL